MIKLNKWDPKAYFRKSKNNTIIILGPRRSGKSILVKFLYESIWKNQFDLVIVFTKCPSTATFYNEFIVSYKGDGSLVRNEPFNIKILDTIKQIQEKRAKDGKKPLHILMILDDAVDKSLRHTQEFSDIFLFGRHESYNIQLVFCTQSAGALAPEQRENLDLFITFRLNLRSDKDKVFKEFIGGLLTYEELPDEYKNSEFRFLDHLNTELCKNHHCMVVDFKDHNKTKFNEMVTIFKAPIKK